MSDYTLNVLIEGYDEQKAQKVIDQHTEIDRDWRDVYESRQNSTILQAELMGLEEKVYQVSPEKKMLCGIVEIGQVRGLLPLDFMGVDNREGAKRIIGEKIAFVVIGLDKASNFFVGSRKEAIRQMAERALRRIDQGDKILAVVRQVYNSNVIVDIGGIQSSIPASEASYGWVDSMHDLFKVGDHIEVKVTSIEKQKQEVQLSVKALQSNPWDRANDYFKEHGEYVAKVSGIAEFGTYVTLRDGISGLGPHLRHEVVKKGDKVLVRVLKIKQKQQQMNIKILKVF